jgi:hypothetical protein
MVKARTGYRVPRRTALVEFDEAHEYYGAEIVLRLDVPIGVMLEFQRAATDEGQAETVIRRFGDDIVLEWNLEDDEGPVPATGDGLMMQSFAFANMLLSKWVEVATQVPGPLGEPSNNGNGWAASTDLVEI